MIEPCDWETIEREERPQAVRIAEYLARKHPGASVLDVGCGPGLYVEEMLKVGISAYGVDNDPRLVENDNFARWDITSSDPLRVSEIVLSLEVGEHIPAEKADAYVSFIANTIGVEIVYFSAARPGQGGIGHINCQPKAYWVKLFHEAGFWLDPDATDEWISWMRQGPYMGWLLQNGMVFRNG